MKKTFFTSTAAAAVLTLAGALTATQVLALTSDDVISILQGQGYTSIEVKVGPTQIKAEASNGTDKIEVIYDKETGDVLKQEIYAGEGGDVDEGIEVDQSGKDFSGDDDDDDHDEGEDHDDDHSGKGGGDDHDDHDGGGDDHGGSDDD